MEIEESIDLSFKHWVIKTETLYRTSIDSYFLSIEDYIVVKEVNDYIHVVDNSIQNSVDMTLRFNSIDIGYVKMKLRMPSEKESDDFAIEFLSQGVALFKLEKICDSFALIIGTFRMRLFDRDTNWHTIEIFFDLSISGEEKISIKVDGNEVVDDLIFPPHDTWKIDTIHMYTGIIPKTTIDVNFEKLNNLKKI